jgi:translation initiation factor IF-3
LSNVRSFDRRHKDVRSNVVYNDAIRVPQVRLSHEDGSSEILSTYDALKLAENKDLDLIMISAMASPPVCRIMDIGKYLYDQKQREKEAAKKARESVIEQKEIRMGLNIDKHDIDIKVANIRKMLEKRCKVTLTVTLRGRERGKQEMARTLLLTFAEQLGVELEPFSMGGNRISAKIK